MENKIFSKLKLTIRFLEFREKLKFNELHLYKTKIFYVRNNEKPKEN